MDRKKILFIALAILIVAVVVLILMNSKGSLIINTKDTEVSVNIGTTEFTTFPQKLKLKKGVYYIRATKEGYLDYDTEVKISPFKKVEIIPEFKKVITAGYAPRGAFLYPTLPAGKNLIYYYNPREKGFLKMDVDFTGEDIKNLGESTLTNNNLVLEDAAETPYIRWSKNNKYVIFVSTKQRVLIDLETRKEIKIPEEAKAIDFISDDEVAYAAEHIVYKSDLSFSSPQKISVVDFNPDNSFSSPGGQKIVFANNEAFAICDFSNTKNCPTINESITNTSWFDDNTLAVSSKKREGLMLELVDLKTLKTTELAPMYENGFSWASATNIIYTKEDNGTVSLVSLNWSRNTEKLIYETPIRNTIETIASGDKKLIFTISGALYVLNL